MFLNPVVPGVPVYITGGIVVVRQAMLSGKSFWLSVVIASMCCWSIKMASVVVQHKVIGEQMSRSATIRSLVKVNSDATRAMAKILQVPGLSMPKTCILVGMPDWPTTVFTGILRLPVGPIFLGSLPSIVLIFPTGALLKYEAPFHQLCSYFPWHLALNHQKWFQQVRC
jgi:hypothetical protein